MNPTEYGQRRPRVAELLHGVEGTDWKGDAPSLADEARMDLIRFLGLAEQMARLVARVHERGVTHGDLRPENFRRRDGELLLTGFGHAVTFETSSSDFAPLDRLPSDATYLAPEQTGRMNRPVDYRADLYALGGTLYRLATGHPPFPDRSQSALIHAHLAEAPRPPGELAPWMPPAVSQIILRLLAKEPDERYPSASGLADDLAHLRAAAERGKTLDQVSLRAGGRVLKPRAPRRHHGRDHALGALLAAFDAVTRGGSECLFVAGEAGVGKTSLVNELQHPVALRAGRFVRGKCQQFQRDRPLLAPVQALQQLLTLLAAESDEMLQELRPRMRAGLGPDAGALLEVLPELAQLTGKLAPPVPLDPGKAQRRLTELLVRFVALAASPSQPLVIVLDDLQWADQPTLDFVAALLEDDELDGVMLAGLFRSGELDGAPALRDVTEKMSSAVVHLENLPPGDLSSLVGEMLGVPAGEVGALAEQVRRSTHGNPFHAIELVRSLHREGVLLFDDTQERWTWDADALTIHPASANVVEFLTRNLSDFPPVTADALVCAACLGADLTLDLLALATDRTPEEIAAALLPALERGVLVTPDAVKFTRGEGSARIAFCHDRMQQAAVSLRDEAWRARRHLEMGRRLACAATDPSGRERVAGHYAEACALLEDAEEKEKVAALFLEAARRARKTGSFASAHRFLRLALDLLSPEPWSYAPALAWDLHEELHVVCYCLPDYPAADAAFADLRAHSTGAAQIATAASIQVMSLSNRTRYEEALQLGADLLGEFGIAVPLDDPEALLPTDLTRLYERIEAGALRRLPGRGPGPVENSAAARLLNRMVPAAFFCRPVVANWLVVHAAHSWLAGEYDDARLYPMACLSLATILARADYATGYQAARAALSAGESGERGVETARARHVFGLFNCHWFEPLEHGFAQALEAHESLRLCGELEFACYTFFTSQAALLDFAAHLGDLDAENRLALDFAAKTGNRHATESYTAFRGLIDALGEGSAVDAPEIPAANPMAACFHHTARALTACLFGDDEAHAHHADAATRLAPYITGFYPTALINVLDSLAIIAHRRGGDRDPVLAGRLAANQAWLSARAADAPQNFSHLHDLVEAERMSAEGRGTEALAVYERAIRGAKAHQRPWHAALATERAARCYLALGLEQAGHGLLEQAHSLYADWGAKRKSEALASEFSFLRTIASGFREAQPLVAAMQQLATLRSVPQLAAATAEILQKLSGATDGQILALDQHGQWMLKAGFSPEGPPVRQTMEEAEERGLIPATVVRLGLRQMQTVLCEDAVQDTRFMGDRRFRDVERCAVLGVPVISRNRAVAFVVLENRRLRGAFSKDMAEMVQSFCGQLAVSIDNVRLYQSLETQVEQRTRELRTAEETLARTAIELTENIPVGTYVLEFDADGAPHFTFLSERFLAMTGLKREEVMANHALALQPMSSPDRAEIERLNREVFAAKKPFFWEGEITVRGEKRHVTLESTPRSRPAGGTIWEGVMTDITERRKSEQQLRIVLDNIPVAVAENTLTSPAKITFINENFTRIFGYTLDEVPTVQDWAERAYPDPSYRREVFREWDEAVFCAIETKGSVQSMEFEVACKDGSRRNIMFSAATLSDRLLVTMTDITGRKLAEQNLADAHRSMQLAASAAQLGFWELNVTTGLDRWDEEMAHIHGITLAEFDGHWEKFVHPEDHDEVMRQTRRMLESDRIFEMEYRILRPDGEVRHIREHGIVVRDEKGLPLRASGVVQDITMQKTAVAREKELEAQHRRDLENKLKTSLAAAAVAHEINQPLSAILLRTKMALQEKGDGLDALSEVANEAQRVVTTIEKMKTLMRSVQTEHNEFDLAGVVRSALLYNKTMLSRHDITVRASGLDKAQIITGDDAQLQLAITNILRNAAEAIDESAAERREISIGLSDSGSEVILVIGDSGPGWSGAELAETPLTTTKKGGTGIGLYVARTAMENHRGGIEFGRSPLGGAEVRLKFPRITEKA